MEEKQRRSLNQLPTTRSSVVERQEWYNKTMKSLNGNEKVPELEDFQSFVSTPKTPRTPATPLTPASQDRIQLVASNSSLPAVVDKYGSETGRYLSGFQLISVLLSLTLGTFLVAIDISIVAVAIPKITTDFKALDQVGWYGSAYLMTTTALQPAAGKMYKFFNVKSTYLASILIFELGSVLCAIAPRSEVLILGRAIAGVGAAGVLQGAFGTISYIAPLEKRPACIGAVASTFGISSCLAPTIGGLLADTPSSAYGGWRWVFWINLPLGFVAFILLVWFLHLKQQDLELRGSPLLQKLWHLDPVGVVLLLGTISSLLLALQWGGSDSPWNSPKIVSLLVVFAVLLILFCISQYYAGERATFPLRIIKNRTVAFGTLSLFFFSLATHIRTFYTPFYFQAVQGVSAEQSGVRFLSLAVPQTVAAMAAGGFATWSGHYVRFPLYTPLLSQTQNKRKH
jgi:MFS family permease